MKRLVAFIMVLALAFSVCGCGETSSENTRSSSIAAAVVKEEPEEIPEETPAETPEETPDPSAAQTPSSETEDSGKVTPATTPTETPTPEPVPNAAEQVTATMYCMAEIAPLYREPSTEKDPVAALSKSNQIGVIAIVDGWASVALDNDVYYCDASVLTSDPDWEMRLEPMVVAFDPTWEFADFSAINSGTATIYWATGERKNIIVGVNAGHGCSGGSGVYTYCHPDMTPKVTGGTTAAGNVQAMAASTGMTFFDGTPEHEVTLRQAQILCNMLRDAGYDVLMLRDSSDVQLDNVARAVICNNLADCHISIHWDGDGLDYDKGIYYMAVADGIKGMYPVSEIWQEDDRLGECLISGLSAQGLSIFEGGSIQADLTQTSFSKIPSVDIELGNAASTHSDEDLTVRAAGILSGINQFFGF